MECGVLAVVCLLVIGLYSFAAQSGSLELMSPNAADTYYNLLVQGFRAGQLSLKKMAPPGLAQLADPYDPVANARYRPASDSLVDLSYYKGRFYLYFGVTPALILFWPFAALTGRYLFHREAVAIFCAVGFLVSAGLLRALWHRYFAEVSLGVVVACVLALGLATGVPVLVTRCDVYEVPIACGYMLTILVLGGIWCAFHEQEPRKRSGWLATASVGYGLAVGARPSLLFGAVILLLPVLQARRERKPIGILLAAAASPIMLIGLCLMLYNYRRFENPFEFGLRYELGPARMDTLQLFSLPYSWFNFRVYFLEPARWSSHLPFVHKILVPPLPAGRGEVETAFGVLTNIPLVWLAPLGAGLAWRGRSASERLNLRWFLASVALVFGMNALVLCLFRGANFRYEMEFLPALVLLAVVGILGLEYTLAGRAVWRRAARLGWGVLLGVSVVFNLLVGAVNFADARYCMGNALLREGKNKEAIAEYELALLFNPELAIAHVNMGSALDSMRRSEEAIGQYEQALRLQPDFAEAHNNLAVALGHVGRLAEAIAHYEQALRLKPDYAEAHNGLGVALDRVGQLQEAMAHYEKAVRIEPDFAEAHYDLGSALLRLGRVQEAIAHCQRAIQLNPDLGGPYNTLGVALQEAGKIQEAIGYYQLALQRYPNSAEAHYNLGSALEKTGRVQEAIGHYQQALRNKPDLAAAHNALARLSAVQ